MLIVSRRPNAGYNGRFLNKATALVKQGTRVGMMYVSGEPEVRCHVCQKDFSSPIFEEGQQDHWGECTHCKTPFVFARAVFHAP